MACENEIELYQLPKYVPNKNLFAFLRNFSLGVIMHDAKMCGTQAKD